MPFTKPDTLFLIHPAMFWMPFQRPSTISLPISCICPGIFQEEGHGVLSCVHEEVQPSAASPRRLATRGAAADPRRAQAWLSLSVDSLFFTMSWLFWIHACPV